MGAKYEGTTADIWSCGVILFALLTGKLPFDDDNIRRLLSKVKSGIFSMPQFLHKDAKDLLWRMLTVDPKQRITMEQLKQHPWFRSNHIHSPTIQHVSERVGERLKENSEIDEEILRSLLSLGVGDETQVREALLSSKHNIHQVFYELLMQRKQKPVETFMRPTRGKSLSGRNRGNSAPVLVETIPPVTPAAPLSPVSSPRSRRKQLAEMQRRNSSSTSPVSIMGASNRFQRIKLEETAPGSPIIGSSPKKSWFTSFFAKADKEKEPPQGILSRKPLTEITKYQKIFSNPKGNCNEPPPINNSFGKWWTTKPFT